MASPFSQALIRFRWGIILFWVVLGYLAAQKSPEVVQALNVRGGSRLPTEAGQVDILLRRRFSKPLSDFFAITIESPGPVDSTPTRTLLDTLITRLQEQRYISGVASFRSTGDSTFVSQDGHRTFLIVGVDIASADTNGSAAPTYCRPLRQ